MGLDMYLKKSPKIEGRTFSDVLHFNSVLVNSDYESFKLTPYYELIKDHIKEVGTYHKWHSIQEEVGYWRKANAIHNWFVEKVQGGEDECNEHLVSKEHVLELLELCKRILANRELATVELPPTSGFFFGSTEIGDWYFSDLTDTVEILEKVLESVNFDTEYLIYRSSW